MPETRSSTEELLKKNGARINELFVLFSKLEYKIITGGLTEFSEG
jgi:hypothetical protein